MVYIVKNERNYSYHDSCKIYKLFKNYDLANKYMRNRIANFIKDKYYIDKDRRYCLLDRDLNCIDDDINSIVYKIRNNYNLDYREWNCIDNEFRINIMDFSNIRIINYKIVEVEECINKKPLFRKKKDYKYGISYYIDNGVILPYDSYGILDNEFFYDFNSAYLYLKKKFGDNFISKCEDNDIVYMNSDDILNFKYNIMKIDR